jgi:hypothetical protein
MRNLLLFIILVFVIFLSCKKEEGIVQNHEFWSSQWIIGEWKLKEGFRIIGNDTINYYKDDNMWRYDNLSHLRESYIYKDTLIINFFSDNSFTYHEGGDPSQGLSNYTVSNKWSWISTNKPYTHIKCEIDFNPQPEPDIFRVISINDTILNLEYKEQEFYLSYKFYKTKHFQTTISDDSQNRFDEVLPKNIIGKWKLESFLNKESDDFIDTYSNDTLTSKYIYVDYYGNPIKMTIKSKYSLEISIADSGIYCPTEYFQNENRNWNGYWYWTDDINPHKKVFIQPTMLVLWIIDYDLIQLDNDYIILQKKYDNNPDSTAKIVYKFRRII